MCAIIIYGNGVSVCPAYYNRKPNPLSKLLLIIILIIESERKNINNIIDLLIAYNISEPEIFLARAPEPEGRLARGKSLVSTE